MPIEHPSQRVLTAPGGVLKPHFWGRLLRELEAKGDRKNLERIFEPKTTEQWE